jgi:hypothetical protein
MLKRAGKLSTSMLVRIREVVDDETFKNIELTDRGLAGGDVGACLHWLYRNDETWRVVIEEAWSEGRP